VPCSTVQQCSDKSLRERLEQQNAAPYGAVRRSTAWHCTALRWLCNLRGSWIAIFAANMALCFYGEIVQDYNKKETAWKQVASELSLNDMNKESRPPGIRHVKNSRRKFPELLSSRREFLGLYKISSFSYFLLWIVKARWHENSFRLFFRILSH